MKTICVLGITGSIGKNIADIVYHNPTDFQIIGCSFNKNIDEFKKIYTLIPTIKYVSVGSLLLKNQLEENYSRLTVFLNPTGLEEVIDAYNYDLICNALVGFIGLPPTIHAINRGINIALANKESLVVGGSLIKKLLIEKNVKLFPIDSEHVALAKCLKNKSKDDVNRLIITASGGPFRALSRDELDSVSVEQALNHPSWIMGPKITIDSATMMNKGFEIIEAYYLFDFPLDKIVVLLHDESIIHSAIEMKDHSLVCDLGPADMRIPISYALYEENYHELDNVQYLNLEEVGGLHFRKFSSERYPAVELAKKSLLIGGSMPCVLNAANEACNEAFRQHKLSFNKIENIIEKVMQEHKLVVNPSLEELIKINDWAYNYAYCLIEKER